MYVFADRDFITLGNLFDAEDNNRHTLSYRSLLSNTASGNNHLAGYASQTDENQIGPLSLGALYSIWFIFGYQYSVAIRYQQHFNAIAGFLDILPYQYEQIRVVLLVLQNLWPFCFSFAWPNCSGQETLSQTDQFDRSCEP